MHLKIRESEEKKPASQVVSRLQSEINTWLSRRDGENKYVALILAADEMTSRESRLFCDLKKDQYVNMAF